MAGEMEPEVRAWLSTVGSLSKLKPRLPFLVLGRGRGEREGFLHLERNSRSGEEAMFSSLYLGEVKCEVILEE